MKTLKMLWKVQSFLDIKISYSAESNSSSLQRFWISFIDMVNILLNTICAIRLGQWELLLECIRDMLPYVFAYDKINYARYLTCMLGEMLSLKEECPEVYEEFKKGNFSAQLTEGNLFSRSETDKVIKLLLIKTPGGTTGFSTNPNAVNRWELNAAYRAQLRSCFYKHINYNQQMYKHADLYPSRIKKDEDDVQSILKTINESFIDPFNDLGLLSISSGVIAMSKVETDCLSANQYGKKAMEKFISCDATHSLFDPMKKQKLSTFTNIYQQKLQSKR